MKTRQCILPLLVVLLLAATAGAQTLPGATIGIFFDEDAEFSYAMVTDSRVVECYVCAIRAEMMVGGAAFKVAMPEWLPLLAEHYPAGLQIGDLLGGVELGLTAPLPVFGTDAGVLATFSVLAPSFPFATLEVLPHALYDTPVLADASGNMVPVEGALAWLTHPDANESATWGEVKGLFR